MRPLEAVALRGKLVTLEPLSLAHVDALTEIARNAPTDEYSLTTVPRDPSGMRGYVQIALDLYAQGEALPFATTASGRVVGCTRFANIERWKWQPGHPLQRGEEQPDAVEIGWTWLAPEAQRTAVNTEAKLLMLTHAFEAWRVHRVTLKTDSRNRRSRAAIERIGGRLDGVVRAHMPGADGIVRDTAFFSLLAAEWPEAKGRLIERLSR